MIPTNNHEVIPTKNQSFRLGSEVRVPGGVLSA